MGEIEDEFDLDEDEGDIYALADNTFRVSGDTPLERVAEAFDVSFAPTNDADDDNKFDTICGYIAHAMGHVPRRGEFYDLQSRRFEVLLTKAGAVKWFKVRQLKDEAQVKDA